MKQILNDQYNHLLKVRVDYHGPDQWYMKPEFTKKSHAANNGHYMFRGDDNAFRKHLMRLKATDTDSLPASSRNVKYKDMVQRFKEPKRTYCWVYSTNWNASNKIGENEVKKIIEIQEEVKIPGTNIILEKGDSIRVLNEESFETSTGVECSISGKELTCYFYENSYDNTADLLDNMEYLADHSNDMIGEEIEERLDELGLEIDKSKKGKVDRYDYEVILYLK